jgi:hypothetical protein
LLNVRVEKDETFRWTFFVPCPRSPVLAFIGEAPAAVPKMAGFRRVDLAPDRLEKLLHEIPKGTAELGVVCGKDDWESVQSFLKDHHDQLPGLSHAFLPSEQPKSREDLLRAWVNARNPQWKVDFLGQEANRPGPEQGSARVGANDDQLCNLLAETDRKASALSLLGSERSNRLLLVDHWNAVEDPIHDLVLHGWHDDARPRGPGVADDGPLCRADLSFEGHCGGERLREILQGRVSSELVEELARASIIRILVVDERLGKLDGAADQRWGSIGTRRDRWSLAGVDIMRVPGSEADLVLLDSIEKQLGASGGRYDYVFIHLGILEKCSKLKFPALKHELRVWELMRSLATRPGPMNADGSRAPLRLVVHSGRTAPRPPAELEKGRPPFRFCPLATVERLLVGPPPECCKLDFVRTADAIYFRPEDFK